VDVPGSLLGACARHIVGSPKHDFPIGDHRRTGFLVLCRDFDRDRDVNRSRGSFFAPRRIQFEMYVGEIAKPSLFVPQNFFADLPIVPQICRVRISGALNERHISLCHFACGLRARGINRWLWLA
jgi:hypothetical protein